MGRKQFERPERIQFSDDHYAVETLAVRAGQWRTEEGEHSDDGPGYTPSWARRSRVAPPQPLSGASSRSYRD